MQSDVEHFVMHACECLKRKRPSKTTRAPLTPITTTYPFELVSIDFLHLETCKHGYEYILVVMDHFTRFAQAYATKNKSAKTVVEKVFDHFALNFGFPARIHHDMGREFENKLFSQLQQVCGMRGSHTTPYHPQGNGQVERFNRTLLSMLRTLTDAEKAGLEELTGESSARLQLHSKRGYWVLPLLFVVRPHSQTPCGYLVQLTIAGATS